MKRKIAKPLFVRDLDPDVYLQTKIEALKRKVKIGTIINEALVEYLKNH